MFRNIKSLEAESRLVLAWEGEGREKGLAMNEHQGILLGSWRHSKIDLWRWLHRTHMLIIHVFVCTYVCSLEDFAVVEEHEQSKFSVGLEDGPPQSHTIFHGPDWQTVLVCFLYMGVCTHTYLHVFVCNGSGNISKV